MLDEVWRFGNALKMNVEEKSALMQRLVLTVVALNLLWRDCGSIGGRHANRRGEILTGKWRGR